jgi:hypothetical protein
MAIIPTDLMRQPFQPSINAEVQPGATHFKVQKDPITIETLVVPDALMMQVIPLWLQTHPQETIGIIRSIKDKQRNELDIIRTVQKSKNG